MVMDFRVGLGPSKLTLWVKKLEMENLNVGLVLHLHSFLYSET